MRRPITILLVFVLSICAASAQQSAPPAAWPVRSVTFVVPFPAGSATDLIARVVARDLSGRIGQPVIIENRPGADGTIGVRQVARSAPDGYTFSFGSPSAYAAAPYVIQTSLTIRRRTSCQFRWLDARLMPSPYLRILV